MVLTSEYHGEGDDRQKWSGEYIFHRESMGQGKWQGWLTQLSWTVAFHDRHRTVFSIPFSSLMMLGRLFLTDQPFRLAGRAQITQPLTESNHEYNYLNVAAITRLRPCLLVLWQLSHFIIPLLSSNDKVHPQLGRFQSLRASLFLFLSVWMLKYCFRPRGMYFTVLDKGEMNQMSSSRLHSSQHFTIALQSFSPELFRIWFHDIRVYNWHCDEVDAIVVTDGYANSTKLWNS